MPDALAAASLPQIDALKSAKEEAEHLRAEADRLQDDLHATTAELADVRRHHHDALERLQAMAGTDLYGLDPTRAKGAEDTVLEKASLQHSMASLPNQRLQYALVPVAAINVPLDCVHSCACWLFSMAACSMRSGPGQQSSHPLSECVCVRAVRAGQGGCRGCGR